MKGLINDNPNLNHVLEQLRTVSDILVAAQGRPGAGLTEVSKFAARLNEAVASGPYFKVVLHNLLPYQIIQPWVDAAFKKRGIDPENFWRSAGLPEFRWPDPNGTRFPNGAPPPAPPVLEGTPEHPGPAVPPGSPCSYTPANPGQRHRRRRGSAAAVESAALRGCRHRPVRRPRLPGAGRRADLAAEPRTVCRRRRASRSPGGRATRPRTFRAHRCRCRRTHRRARAPRTWRRPARRRHRRRSRPVCRRARPHRPGPGQQLPAPFINPGGSGGSGAREVARIEHHL